jgi:hypothetical protein
VGVPHAAAFRKNRTFGNCLSSKTETMLTLNWNFVDKVHGILVEMLALKDKCITITSCESEVRPHAQKQRQ